MKATSRNSSAYSLLLNSVTVSLVLSVIFVGEAYAATSGGSSIFPFTQWLTDLAREVNGPILSAAAFLGFAVFIIGRIFVPNGTMMASLLWFVLVASLGAGGTALLGSMGFTLGATF